MDLRNVWTVASKDFKVFRKKRNVIYSTILFPLLVAVGMPLVVRYAGRNHQGLPAHALPGILNSFSFFFILAAATLPTAIASYSLVGEKTQKSLEPLLASPVGDGEILAGKTISSFLPPIAAIYGCSLIFMALMDRVTYGKLHYYYFPNWTIGVLLLVVAPLAALLSVEVNVVLSSRMNDVRAVQQAGGLMVIPFAGLYAASELGLFSLDMTNLGYVAACLLVADVVLAVVSRAAFRREEILTRWR